MNNKKTVSLKGHKPSKKNIDSYRYGRRVSLRLEIHKIVALAAKSEGIPISLWVERAILRAAKKHDYGRWSQDDHGCFRIKGKHCLIWIRPEPSYSDRGDWMAHVEVADETKLTVDSHDLWPRYFFGLDVAMNQCEQWLWKRREMPDDF